MTRADLHSHTGTPIAVDLCLTCHVIWFDVRESVQLSPASTLELFRTIAERKEPPSSAADAHPHCPRCQARLMLTHDRQRDTPFEYLRCDRGHGRLITFLNFLREKNFVRPLTAAQLADLRRNVRTVNCANCGGSIDLTRESACSHCGSALSMLDTGQAERVIAQLTAASQTRPLSPTLAMDLARARREAEAAFAGDEKGADWWREASSDGAIAAGLKALLRVLP